MIIPYTVFETPFPVSAAIGPALCYPPQEGGEEISGEAVPGAFYFMHILSKHSFGYIYSPNRYADCISAIVQIY